MRKIRVGIIGQGRSGRCIHSEYLAGVPAKFKIVAVADPLAERRERAAREYGCATYASHRSMVKRNDIDLMVNASPTRQHVPITYRCLKAGFSVLCEKPLARKAAEVDKLIRAAKTAGKLLAVFQNKRYDPLFIQVRKVVKSGVLGRIVLIKGALNGFARRWDWQTLRRNHGGSLLNTGPHLLDQTLQFLDTSVKPDITCIMDRTTTYGDAEDHVKLIMRAKGGTTADLEITSCCAFPQYRFNIYGTRGGLQTVDNRVEWRYFRLREQTTESLMLAPLADRSGNPIYCGDKIKWHEKSWTWARGKETRSPTELYYNMLYRTMTQGTPLEVTMDHIRTQIAVIEEGHRQNPPSGIPKADMSA